MAIYYLFWIASAFATPRNDEVEGILLFGESQTKQKLLQGFTLRANFILDCHEFANANSCNDESILPRHCEGES